MSLYSTIAETIVDDFIKEHEHSSLTIIKHDLFERMDTMNNDILYQLLDHYHFTINDVYNSKEE